MLYQLYGLESNIINKNLYDMLQLTAQMKN